MKTNGSQIINNILRAINIFSFQSKKVKNKVYSKIKSTFLMFFLFTAISHSAIVGDKISNIATITYTMDSSLITIDSNIDEFLIENTIGVIDLLSVNNTGTVSEVLGVTEYQDSSGIWHTMSAPIDSDGNVINTSTPTNLNTTMIYNETDLIIISVKDLDYNIDPLVKDILEVTITSTSGDIEIIRLIETGVDTGTFNGYIQSVKTVNSSNDGVIFVQPDDEISASYNDNSTILKSNATIIEDVTETTLYIQKSVNKNTAGYGEILKYELIVSNTGENNANDLVINDYLPQGIKYKEGTAKVNGVKTLATISEDGKNISFNIEELEPEKEVTITFIAEITAGIINGEAINQAWATASNTSKSNIATAKTIIEEELMRSEGIIIGQVYDCQYDKNKNGHGIENVRLYLENGTYVSTDKNGKYHIEGVKHGTHVIQIDEELLPKGYKPGKIVNNARYAGSDISQFVKMGKGSLKRVDFCLNKTKEIQEKEPELKEEVYKYKNPKKTISMPEYNLNQVAGKTEILWPPERYVPDTPSTKIAIAHNKDQEAQVWLNNKKISMLNYDGKDISGDSSTVIDKYRGVDLLDQTNTITVKILDKNKKVVKTLVRKIHVTGRPVRVEYVENKSFNVADGKNNPVIAVRFIDSNDYPVREGITGTFIVDTPYQSKIDITKLQENPLERKAGNNRYTVGADGIAYIQLEPTTSAGLASLHFNIKNRDQVIRAWLKPQLRKWIMVGFAEGTVGYNTLKNKKVAMSNGAEDKTITEGRISFFAKGRIKGDWLMTLAYDTGKDTKNTKMFDEIDPDKYYTLYNDGSTQNYEASSTKKLFVKVEKERLSVLFGDFNTNMTYTELAEYSRSMTGLKAEYNGDNFEANAFVANTEQIFMRDEIRGDGTSGYYQLKNKEIIFNSEKIEIEVRDRYRSEIIISTKILERFVDYSIDYDRGTIFFKEPIYSNDENFNPRYIIANYEVEGDGSKHYTYGGRAAIKNDNIEVGSSYISEDNQKQKTELIGVDTTIKIGTSTIIKAEYAKTKTTEDGNTTYGDAKKIELDYVSETYYLRTYFREQDNSFGLGQLNENLGGTRKFGLEAKKTFENRVSINLLSYRDTDLGADKNQDIFQIKAEIEQKLWSAYTGYRYAKNTDTKKANQIIVGGSYSFFDQKLKLIGTHDQTFGDNEDKLFPTKTTLGFDYSMTKDVTLFANYEWITGEDDYNLGRVGMKYTPWTGMTMENANVSEFRNDVSRVYNTMGINQVYSFNDNWTINLGYENGNMLSSDNIYDINFSEEADEFNAYKLGLNYRDKKWAGLISGEYRDGQKLEKYNLLASLYTQVNDDLALGLSSGYYSLKDNVLKTDKKEANIRFSMAYRPMETKWIILEKLDYVYGDLNSELLLNEFSDENTNKIINNLNANYTPNNRTEFALQYGIKYVEDTIEDYDHIGITHLFGADIRYDITEKIEIGTQGSSLYAYSADNYDYSYGVYAGYNAFENMNVILGYNVEGFDDKDFYLQTYRTKGPYVQFKMKFDQNNLKKMIGFMTL